MGDVDVIERFRATATEVEDREFPDLTAQSRISDLGIDSVAMMEIIGCLEDDLGVQIPDERLAGVQTVGDIERLVRASLG